LQQTPSTQLPPRHCDAVAHAWPSSSAQASAPLHAPLTHSFAGSAPCAIGEHVPTEPATLHASHVPPQATLQQTPSTQLPLAHSPLMVHAAPLPSSVQAPAPLQVVTPGHSLAGSVAAGMGAQTPTLPATLQA
jgi:hypothetical protein